MKKTTINRAGGYNRQIIALRLLLSRAFRGVSIRRKGSYLTPCAGGLFLPVQANFGFLGALLALLIGLFSATNVFAVANVTAGIASASADTAADAGATFTAVSTITIAESANGTFSQSSTTYTLTFSAPAGWIFDMGGRCPVRNKKRRKFRPQHPNNQSRQ